MVAGLGTAAYVDKDNFAPSTILEEATFAYSADELDSNFTRLTIADLFTVVAQLNNQVQTLQQEIEKLKTQTDENKI